MIKYIYPDGSYCYSTLYGTNIVYRDEQGRLKARSQQPDGSVREFEIKAFQILEPGVIYN